DPSGPRGGRPPSWWRRLRSGHTRRPRRTPRPRNWERRRPDRGSWLIAHREWVAPLPRADKRIDLGSLGESLLSAEGLVPEPLRPRVRDLGREQVAQEVLFGLMVLAQDPGGSVLSDPAGHERHDRLPAMGHHQARVREEPFRLGPALLVRAAEVELRDLVPFVGSYDGHHERVAIGTSDLPEDLDGPRDVHPLPEHLVEDFLEERRVLERLQEAGD